MVDRLRSVSNIVVGSWALYVLLWVPLLLVDGEPECECLFVRGERPSIRSFSLLELFRYRDLTCILGRDGIVCYSILNM